MDALKTSAPGAIPLPWVELPLQQKYLAASMGIRHVALTEVEIEDEADFRHVGLFEDLRSILSASGKHVLVTGPGSGMGWQQATFLNLTYWDEGAVDVLPEPIWPADVCMHVAWHHLAHESLLPGPEASLLGEAIASAFDLYLVGRLLGHRPEAAFLATQVPRMAEAAEDAGCDEGAFEALLEAVAASPERAFEDLRALLFDATRALSNDLTPEAAARVLASFEGHRFAPLLHHYELSTWVLRTRLARAATPASAEGTGRRTAEEIDLALRASDDSVAWLERSWVEPALVVGGGRAPARRRSS